MAVDTLAGGVVSEVVGTQEPPPPVTVRYLPLRLPPD